MKLISALLLSSAPLQVWAASLPLFGQSPIKSLEDTFPVAGENPLEYCADPENDILEIVSVNLTPNPPVPYVSKYFYTTVVLVADVLLICFCKQWRNSHHRSRRHIPRTRRRGIQDPSPSQIWSDSLGECRGRFVRGD